MDVSITHLTHIGYILPWNMPRSGRPIPKLLEDEDSFKALISNVTQYVDEQRAKKKGKGTVKPFSIRIVDTSAPTETGKVRTVPHINDISWSHVWVLGNIKEKHCRTAYCYRSGGGFECAT